MPGGSRWSGNRLNGRQILSFSQWCLQVCLPIRPHHYMKPPSLRTASRTRLWRVRYHTSSFTCGRYHHRAVNRVSWCTQTRASRFVTVCVEASEVMRRDNSRLGSWGRWRRGRVTVPVVQTVYWGAGGDGLTSRQLRLLLRLLNRQLRRRLNWWGTRSECTID